MISVGGLTIGGDAPLLLIGGPCAIESEAMAVEVAGSIKATCEANGVSFIFKSSFDKANRTSLSSYRGVGIERGLAILDTVRTQLGVPVLTDIHERDHVAEVGSVCDVLQIPAFLCRQTDLLVAAAGTGRAVNVKKGQFLSPAEMRHVVAKLEDAHAEAILVTERGTTFGYNNLVVDFRSLPVLRGFGAPVVFDATHSVQMPGGAGSSTGGRREYVPYLARAAVAVGVDGVFMEIHPDPDNAPSDGPNMLRLDDLDNLLQSLVSIRSAVDPLPPLAPDA